MKRIAAEKIAAKYGLRISILDKSTTLQVDHPYLKGLRLDGTPLSDTELEALTDAAIFNQERSTDQVELFILCIERNVSLNPAYVNTVLEVLKLATKNLVAILNANKKSTAVEDTSHVNNALNYLSRIQDAMKKRINQVANEPQWVLRHLTVLGDMYRYMSAYHDKYIKDAKMNYDEAIGLCHVITIDAIVLGLVLNYSLFIFETLDDPKEAFKLAQKYLDGYLAEHLSKPNSLNSEGFDLIEMFIQNMGNWCNTLMMGGKKVMH